MLLREAMLLVKASIMRVEEGAEHEHLQANYTSYSQLATDLERGARSTNDREAYRLVLIQEWLFQRIAMRDDEGESTK